MNKQNIIKNTQPIEKNGFVGRVFEQQRIREASNSGESSILIVYGRRRVGKTELIEHTLSDRNLIKMEGVESGDMQTQMYTVLYQLSKWLNDPHITHMRFTTWVELFDFIADKTENQKCTLYFEELQWLAEYRDQFIAELKLIWDNRFRHNPNLLIVLCGSSPSFMINSVVRSKALYNRSSYELHLKPFSISETKEFLTNRSIREIMDCYLTVGAIPEYLNRIKKYSSLQLGICELSFKQQGFLSQESEKIFISSFSKNIHYREIINYLSHVKFATRKDIENHLKIVGGGKLTEILNDLEMCDFIEKYTPYHLNERSLLQRYCISDNYLQFYFKFIKPISADIEHGDYNNSPANALNRESYLKWLGFSFERFCRKNHKLIAKLIGFSAVNYRSGAYFDKKSEKAAKGFQIDLIFDRADRVMTVCEIKYLQSSVGTHVIDEFENKLALMPKNNDATIEKILIASNGANDALKNSAYFDRIITLEDLFIAADA